MNKKMLLKIAALLLGILIVFSFVRDQIIKSAVSVVATQVSGAPVKIEGFTLGLINGRVKITGFKMFNPKGFPEEVLIDIPLIDVKYDLMALLSGKLHLQFIELNLKEVGVLKNKEGKLNVNSLKFSEGEKSDISATATKKEPKPLVMQIDLATLNIGRVIYKDFSVGDKPSVTVYDINIKKTYKNIGSAQQLSSLIMMEALGPTAIKGAATYGAAAIAGVAFLPVGAAVVLTGKDNAKANCSVDFDKAYSVSLSTIKKMGLLISEDKSSGIIKGKVQDCDVTLNVVKIKNNSVDIVVSARKFLFPKPNVASGVIYEISQEISCSVPVK